MLKVYTASKLSEAALWRKFCSANRTFIFHARWLKHSVLKTEDSPDNATAFWLQDEQDVKHADVVLVWAAADQHLRGALVEAGIAIAWGIPVIVIGNHPDYGTWQFHPGVTRVPDFEEAFKALKNIQPSYERQNRPAHRG